MYSSWTNLILMKSRLYQTKYVFDLFRLICHIYIFFCLFFAFFCLSLTSKKCSLVLNLNCLKINTSFFNKILWERQRIQHINGVDHSALLTFLLTKHINSYDNVFLKDYFLLVTYGVFITILLICHIILLVITNKTLVATNKKKFKTYN